MKIEILKNLGYLVAAITIVFICGMYAAYDEIKTDCKTSQEFSIGNQVFDCKSVE